MTVDENYFDGWEQRLGAAYDKPHRWCKCGHIEATHWGQEEPEIPYSCHAIDCKCTKFRPKRRKNRIKFFFAGRG